MTPTPEADASRTLAILDTLTLFESPVDDANGAIRVLHALVEKLLADRHPVQSAHMFGGKALLVSPHEEAALRYALRQSNAVADGLLEALEGAQKLLQEARGPEPAPTPLAANS